MSTITIYKHVKDVKNPHYVGIETIVERIKIGKSKLLIEKIRAEQDKEKRRLLKEGLPSICFSGKFSGRADAKIIQHSGLVAIDFDHLNERLLEFKQRVMNDKYTHLVFVSPSGDGLKVVVKIPASTKTHKFSCDALSDYYKEETLDNFKDVSRVCFESYDPDVYFNPESDVFTTLKEVEVIKRTVETVDIISDYDQIIDNLIVWLGNKGEHYQDGNKHSYLVKIASACLRFGVPEYISCQKIMYKFIHTASAVAPLDFENIFKRVYQNYGNLACTAHFDKKGEATETLTKVKLTDAIFDISLPLKDVIYLDNVRDRMLQTYHTGIARGETTYFKLIDEHFRFKRKHLVLMHGIMNHGKTAMIMQLCLIKSIKNGLKWAFFSPEQDPPDDFYDDLIHTLIGMNTQPYFDGQMSEVDYIKGMDFIKDHFFYIFPDEEAPTQAYINKRFEEVIKKHKVDGCIIDPYNQLDNDIMKFNGREDQYLSCFLTTQKRFAQKHDIFMIVIAHPKGNLTKNGAGDYQCPDVYDLSGGAMWGNKCDDILCTYRPYFSSNKESTIVEFISQKIKKRKLCGSPGNVTLEYDVMSGRYFEVSDGYRFNPLVDIFTNTKEVKSYYEVEKLEQNLNFDYNKDELKAPF